MRGLRSALRSSAGQRLRQSRDRQGLLAESRRWLVQARGGTIGRVEMPFASDDEQVPDDLAVRVEERQMAGAVRPGPGDGSPPGPARPAYLAVCCWAMAAARPSPVMNMCW